MLSAAWLDILLLLFGVILLPVRVKTLLSMPWSLKVQLRAALSVHVKKTSQSNGETGRDQATETSPSAVFLQFCGLASPLSPSDYHFTLLRG